MTWSLPTIIQATPARVSMVRYIEQHLPTAVTYWDDGNDPMQTFLRSLTEQDIGALHLEDDCTLSEQFMVEAQRHIASGDHPVQFFSRLKDDETLGTRVRPGSSWMYNVCFWLPAGMGQEIAAFHPFWKDRDKHRTGFDLLIAGYLQAAKIRYVNVAPSLVQHTSLPSTLGARARGRYSKTFERPLLDGHPFPDLVYWRNNRF